MEFNNAKSFNDLVECNRMYINGVLDETPIHLGPLSEESLVIIDKLLLLSEWNVLTTSSQPAYIKDEHRQCGFIEGANQGNIEEFVNLLYEETRLEYILIQGNKCFKNVTKNVPHENRWDFTQEKLEKIIAASKG